MRATERREKRNTCASGGAGADNGLLHTVRLRTWTLGGLKAWLVQAPED